QQAESYKGDANYTLIKNHFGVKHPAFEQCERGVVTNQPSFIVTDPKCPYALLSCFPPFVWQPFGGKEPPPLERPLERPAFAVGSGPEAADRVLVLSSHTQFWNSAVVQRDTDNWRFMVNTVRWLSDNKKRKLA